jgi:hypothetical protein
MGWFESFGDFSRVDGADFHATKRPRMAFSAVQRHYGPDYYVGIALRIIGARRRIDQDFDIVWHLAVILLSGAPNREVHRQKN